jgi:hypothetical protein
VTLKVHLYAVKDLVTRAGLPKSHIDLIKEQFAPRSATLDSARDSATARTSLLRQLETDFFMTPGSLTMYCPSKMNRKIAEVRIAVGSDVQKLDEYEKLDKHDGELTGGHLEAQLRRFDRLWRVHFFIDPVERERIGPQRLSLLKQGIDKLALGTLLPEESAEDASWLIANGLVHIEEKDSPWKGKRVIQADAAKGASGTAEKYPFGAPRISSLIQ